MSVVFEPHNDVRRDDYDVFMKRAGFNRYLGFVYRKAGNWYAHVNGVYDPDEFGPASSRDEAAQFILNHMDEI